MVVLSPCEVRRGSGWSQSKLNYVRDYEEGELPVLLQTVVVTHFRYHLVPLVQIDRGEQASVRLKHGPCDVEST